MKRWLTNIYNKRKLFVFIFIIALSIRIIFIFTLENKWYFYDTVHYHTAAMSLLKGEGFGESVFPAVDNISAYGLEPVYPIFLGVIYSIFGSTMLAVRIVQAFGSALLCLLIFFIGQRIFGERAGLISGFISVFYPYFIFISGLLYPTVFVTILIALFVFFNLKILDSDSVFYFIIIGILWGLVILTLPIALVFCPFWLLWILLLRRHSIRIKTGHIIVASLCCFLMLIPWTIRNYIIFKRLVPIRAYSGEVDGLSEQLKLEELYKNKVAGDVFKVILNSNNEGNHFECYYNDKFIGRLSDPAKIWGNTDTLYSGLMLAAGLKNNITSFTTVGYSKNSALIKKYKNQYIIDTDINDSLALQMGKLKDAPNIIKMTDSFNRPTLGPFWCSDSEYRIISDELSNTARTGRWGYLAVFNAITSPSLVAVEWGMDTNNEGINEAALALMLDSESINANGYMVWRNPAGGLRLWTLENGNPGRVIDFKKEILSHEVPKQNLFVKLLMTILKSPSTFFKGYFTEFIHFWNPQVDRVKNDNRFNTLQIKLIGAISFSVILTFALIGIFFIERNKWRFALLLFLLVLSFAFGYSFFGTQTRYRIPIDPYLIIIASQGIVALPKYLNIIIFKIRNKFS